MIVKAGILFEYWFKLYYKPKYQDIINQNDQLIKLEEIIISKNKYKFLNWLFMSFLNISQKTLSIQKEFNYTSTLLYSSKSQKKLEYHKGVSQSIRTCYTRDFVHRMSRGEACGEESEEEELGV